jgi:hypothetical protein
MGWVGSGSVKTFIQTELLSDNFHSNIFDSGERERERERERVRERERERRKVNTERVRERERE